MKMSKQKLITLGCMLGFSLMTCQVFAASSTSAGTITITNNTNTSINVDGSESKCITKSGLTFTAAPNSTTPVDYSWKESGTGSSCSHGENDKIIIKFSDASTDKKIGYVSYDSKASWQRTWHRKHEKSYNSSIKISGDEYSSAGNLNIKLSDQ